MSAESGHSGYVVAAGLFVSLAGGWWLGLVLLVLSSPARNLLDAGALLVAVAALCGAYSLVLAAGGPLTPLLCSQHLRRPPGPALSKPRRRVADAALYIYSPL